MLQIPVVAGVMDMAPVATAVFQVPVVTGGIQMDPSWILTAVETNTQANVGSNFVDHNFLDSSINPNLDDYSRINQNSSGLQHAQVLESMMMQ